MSLAQGASADKPTESTSRFLGLKPLSAASNSDQLEPDFPTTGSPVIDLQVKRAIGFIEGARRQTFDHVPKISVDSDEEFTAALDDEGVNNRDSSWLETFEAAMKTMHLVEADTTFDANELTSGVADQVLGFYDPRDEALHVRSTADNSIINQITIVHELTHALDDQLYGIDLSDFGTQDLPADKAEEEFAYRSLVEGSATWVENKFIESLTRSELKQLAREYANIDGSSDLPQAVIDSQVLPYLAGSRFVEEAHKRQGLSGIAHIFESPPVTAEQVADFDRYLNSESPTQYPQIDHAGEVLDQGSFDLYDIDLVLKGDQFNSNKLSPAATGWGTGAFLLTKEPNQFCATWEVNGDTKKDTDEILQAFQTWAQKFGASVSTSGAYVRVESCVEVSLVFSSEK